MQQFTKDFAYGGAIRHLVDRGYTVDQIIREFHYPISRDSIERTVREYEKEKTQKNRGDKTCGSQEKTI